MRSNDHEGGRSDDNYNNENNFIERTGDFLDNRGRKRARFYCETCYRTTLYDFV